MSEENTTVEETVEEVEVEAQPEPTPPSPQAPAQLGLKETMEALDALELVAGTVVKALEDGKVTVADLVHLAALAKELDTLVAGVKDVDDALAELKDLDQTELLQVVVKVFGIVKSIAKAKTVRGL